MILPATGHTISEELRQQVLDSDDERYMELAGIHR
jgi:hypothetical protein